MAVSASQGTLYDKISITWPASDLASGYDLYRSDSSGSRGSLIGSDLPGTSFDDTSVPGGVYYYYTVVAKNAAGSGPDSWQAIGWRKIPEPVDILTASQGSVLNTAQLTWGGVADATGYKIYRATTPGGALMLIGTATGATYTDSTTSANTYYFYKVSAVVGSSEGPLSNEAVWGASNLPEQVTGVSASEGVYYDKVRVTWSPANNATGYDVYRSGRLIASNLTGLGYDDAGVTAVSNNYYTVVAKNADGRAPESALSLGSVKFFDPINDLTATQGSIINTAQLHWGAVTGATSYKVYRATTPGGASTLIGAETDPGYKDTSTRADTYYYYTVTPVVGSNEGEVSNEAAWVAAPLPGRAEGVVTTTLSAKVKISWNASALASGYDLYRSYTKGSRGSLIGSDLSGTSFDDTSGVISASYYYTVVAKNAAGSAPDSIQVEGFSKFTTAVKTLTASQGTVFNAVQLNWDGVAEATGYKVFRATSPTGALTLLDTISYSSTSYNDSTAAINAYYYYRVTASFGSTDAASGNQSIGWVKRLPDQATLVNASQGTQYGQVNVGWNASALASGYDLYRSDSPGSRGSLIGSNITVTHFDDTSVSGAANYYYTVVATNTYGNAPDSAQALGSGKVPAAVTTLTATQGTLTAKVRLTWVGVADATSYQLFRSTSSGNAGVLLANVDSNTVSFDDDTAIPGTAFYYRVQASVGSVVSQLGNEAAGWSKQPDKITSLAASQGTATGLVMLSWSPDPDATSYEIWRSPTPGGMPLLLQTTAYTTFLDTSAGGVSNYYYTVKTQVRSVTGPFSNEAKGYANAAPTSATLSIETSASSVSAETSPSVSDPNSDAGQTEAFAFAITEQPLVGLVSMSGGKFIYSPPDDGSFSGTQAFKFSVTDKGGETLLGNGSIHVVCENPAISSLTTTSPLLIATQFSSTLTYSVPACSQSKQVDISVLDNNNNPVYNATLTNAELGMNKSLVFDTPGLFKAGLFTIKAKLSTDIGEVSKATQLQVKPVNLPVIAIAPSSTVIVGEDTVSVTLQNPSSVNCQFTKDQTVALNDPSKCWVELSTPPEGMSLDNSGVFPAMQGMVSQAGQYDIDANVSKFNGEALLNVGKVTKRFTATCPKPTISSLSATSNLLPFIKPEYTLFYDALACNGALSGTLTITDPTDGRIVDTQTLPLSQYGSHITVSALGQGLPEGNYAANLSITGTGGNATKSIAISVKAIPLPAIAIAPALIDQGESHIVVGVTPSSDTSCPLTGNQAEAENDPRRCFVKFESAVAGLQAGFDSKGLPVLSGYSAISGTFTVSLAVSRWVDGQRYDAQPITKALIVRGYSLPKFQLSGKTDLYAGISKSDLVLKQKEGTNCYLFLNYDEALQNAVSGKKACLAELSLPSELSPAVTLNTIQLAGAFTTPGDKSVSYVVNKVFSDGVKQEVDSGSVNLHVSEPPPPGISFLGGEKIAENKYFLASGTVVTRLKVSSTTAPSAKFKITIDDGVSVIIKDNINNDGFVLITTKDLHLLQERAIKVRVAWVDYPGAYNEKILTVVGGPKITPKLVVETPESANSTDDLVVKVKAGQYTANGFIYDPLTMGHWKTQLFVESNTASKAPASAVVDLINGEATLTVNPANKLFMKISASAELLSSIEGINYPIKSSTKYVKVVNTAPIVGIITSKQLEAPAPKNFTLNLEMTIDNKVVLKEAHWEESSDNGSSWQEFSTLSPLRASVKLLEPGRKLIRVKMLSTSGLESYTTPVEVWAYGKLDAKIIGPIHVAPGYQVTLGAELYRYGNVINNGVLEWEIKYADRTEKTAGPTATIQSDAEGKVTVNLNVRPSDTRADDKYAWTTARHTISIKNPAKPSVSAQGPRDVEIGKTYHYEGTVRPSWGTMVSLHTVKSEWALPNGSTVAGNTLDWTPGAQDLVDKKPLLFRAWVDGFKDSTTRETTISYVPWEYVWPTFTLTMKQLTVQAPSDLTFMVEHDQPAMNRRFEGLTYAWSFPNNVTGRQNDAFPNRASGQALFAGNYTVSVTIRDARGNQTVLTQPIVTEQAAPYAVTLKVGKSNAFDRVPMTVTVRPTISGGHPLDSVTSQTWKVDGIPVDEYGNRSFMISNIAEAGSHTISYIINSRMGITTTVNSPLQLIANLLPVCELKATPNAYVVYAEAKCTDPDGKVIGYSWRVNGEAIGSTSYRISFSKNDTPQSALVTIVATDDAKEQSMPVSLTVNY